MECLFNDTNHLKYYQDKRLSPAGYFALEIKLFQSFPLSQVYAMGSCW